MTDIKKLAQKSGGRLDELLEKQKEYLASIQPVDVAMMFEDEAVTVRVPFIMPEEFSELTARHAPQIGVAVDASLWFSLSGVTAAYPGVVLIVDGVEDDLYRVRDKEAVYIWPEVYAAMSPEDAKDVRMAVWALHIWEPQKRHAEALKREKGADSE